MAKGIIDVLFGEIFDSNWIGKRGEKLTERELKFAKFCGCEGKVLRNIYVPKDNGEMSEIDVLFITQKGLFVIESKNYSGWIFGDEKATYWTAMLANKEKNKFFNPIKQNGSHIKSLSKYLNDNTPLFSVIVFSERCELKKITINSSGIYLFKRNQLYEKIKEVWDYFPDKLDDEDIERIYEKLKGLADVDTTLKKAHINNIDSKYKKTIDNSKNNKSKLKCPYCDSDLVFRVAKRGNNIGKSFYGCSNFPRCKYTQNAD